MIKLKYCVKCGTALEDTMTFCHKCGTVAVSVPESNNISTLTQPEQQSVPLPPQPRGRFRAAMLVWAIIFFTVGTIPIIANVSNTRSPSASTPPPLEVFVGMAAWFYILSAMFLILMKSPKGNPHLFGKHSGMRKVALVHLCIWVGLAIYLTMVFVGGINAAAG